MVAPKQPKKLIAKCSRDIRYFERVFYESQENHAFDIEMTKNYLILADVARSFVKIIFN